jgi:hypothetical protein
MNKLALALALVTTAGVLQVPLAFAALPAGCTGDPHDRDSGPTGNPHDRDRSTPSHFETGNPHDSAGLRGEKPPVRAGDICPGSQLPSR